MNYSVMIDLIIMGCAYMVMVWVIINLLKRRKFTLDSDVVPPGKKFTVKIVSDYGEKAEFASLEEQDIKQVIETLVALKKQKKKGNEDG